MGPRSPRPAATLGVAALCLAACSLSAIDTPRTRPRRAPTDASGDTALFADAPAHDALAEIAAPDAPLDAPLDAGPPDEDRSDAPFDAPFDAPLDADGAADADAGPTDADRSDAFDAHIDAPTDADAATDAPIATEDTGEAPPCNSNADCRGDSVCVQLGCGAASSRLCMNTALCRTLSTRSCACDGRAPSELCGGGPLAFTAYGVPPVGCGHDAGGPDVPVVDTGAPDAFDCNTACPAKPNAMTSCASGTCGYTCVAGFGNCNGDSTDGCEVDLNTALPNCGRCGNACGAGTECVRGACVCRPGTTLCGGACVDMTNDTANCGGCSALCAAGQTCVGGMCVCMPRWRCTNSTTLLCEPDGVQCEPGGDLYCRTVASCRLPPGGDRCWTCAVVTRAVP